MGSLCFSFLTFGVKYIYYDKERVKNISNTIYDDVFRTLINDCKELLIPLVNEIFNKNYEGNEEIILKQNEILLRQQGNIQKRITDTSFGIRSLESEKNYHLECQSKVDGSIMIRMYEYDSQIALNNRELNDETLYVEFPMSAIIYLRSYNNTADVFRICIKTSDGKEIHNIPVLKLRNYDIEDIFSKRLLLLIPFYIFNYESRLNIIDKDVEKYDELMYVYKDIVDRLNILHKQEMICEYTKITLFELTKMVIDSLAEKYDNIRKGVGEIMGGKILDHPAKTIRNEGIRAYIKLAKKFNVEDNEIIEGIVKEFKVSEDYIRYYFEDELEKVEKLF